VTIIEAWANLRDAAAEYEHRDFICRQHARICGGHHIWRERHPLDRIKLRARRMAKLQLKRARWYLDHALATQPAEGCA
jgi:hypothetical protein